MPKLTIDGQEVEVPPGSTVLQACEAAGREVPVFCFHPRLNIAGNCRMCLVEVEKMPKPQASCALPVAEGMVVKTDTPAVHKARKGVLELLLINHPLDCPICDQGGECDLQDLTLFYGPDHSRFAENKRPVADKYLGPLISTHMTRCIHCTRCIRFFTEVAGVEELGAVHRGEHMEITTWVEHALGSEISGNVIDLCPVGALNSKPYEYRARTWELRKTESVDVSDAMGCNIRVDARGSEVMRILPRLNEGVNEEWISDKARFAYDGLKRRRLDTPMVKAEGKLRPTGWNEAFAAVRARLEGADPRKLAFIVGDLVDCETMVLVRDLAERLGTPHVDCRQDGAALDASRRAGYLFNSSIAGIDQADACLLIGTNPRLEAPVLNARLRKRWRAGGFRIGRIGAVHPLTYPVEELGAGPETLAALVRGEIGFAEALREAKRP
ncbi:MAG: NADH-quinone oxidoreductase subunit NuoG, partial [Geminicoccaceae bacterium]